MRYLKYTAMFILGFLIAKFWYEKKETTSQKEEVKMVINTINNMSKLVVTEATFSEMYNYSESKKYFYNYLSFDKKAIVSVNAKVEIGYDLSQLDIQIDSIARQIIINKIPTEHINISPDVKYFDLQQSKFNSFSKEELNTINHQSINKIKSTIEMSELKEKAKKRLLEELSKIYQLSSVFSWEVVNNTDTEILGNFNQIKY